MKSGLRVAAAIFFLTAPLGLTVGCSDSQPPTKGAEESNLSQSETAEVPLVTLKHWRDSTPGERYSFLIGFVTMLELEKEWQGRADGQILPFERSLVPSWVIGFADRPLTEIYNGLNKYLADNPGDLDRPVAEVMWFIYVKPRLDERERSEDLAGDGNPEETGTSSRAETP